MLIIISYIGPISSKNTEVIHTGEDLYGPDLSCPGDKHPLMKANVQSTKNTVGLSALEENMGKCGGLKAVVKAILLC